MPCAGDSGSRRSSWRQCRLDREMELGHRITGELCKCFVDGRDQRYVEYSVEESVAQRINGITLVFEDLNDHDLLRLDRVHAMMADKVDITGEKRNKQRDRGKASAVRAKLNNGEVTILDDLTNTDWKGLLIPSDQ